jgi:methylenetetrahydrofolate/methylenetetrahydromethanopterin dehydrogenase (NADP+)
MNQTDKRKILIQLDSDPHPSVFDRVVAVDAGAEEIFAYGGVTMGELTGLVHGAIFTRGPADLKRTAIFIGGASVGAGEEILARVTETFMGPLRVSVMMDANGSNTTAAAAVICARKHLPLSQTTALVLGTGPVGVRAARLLAYEGAKVYLSSRSAQRSKQAADSINQIMSGNRVVPSSPESPAIQAQAIAESQLLIASGPAGVQMMDRTARTRMPHLKVAIDLNAVPPLGLEGVEVMDKAKERDGMLVYGAIGVGGTKMKIHKAALASLFESNDKVLDAEQIYELGKKL